MPPKVDKRLRECCVALERGLSKVGKQPSVSVATSSVGLFWTALRVFPAYLVSLLAVDKVGLGFVGLVSDRFVALSSS